jgi:nitroimidazol reductase NimA-like FMN-containing flavoprotein (pyridoxamine 5'-phosphate oxidase superfamily)
MFLTLLVHPSGDKSINTYDYMLTNSHHLIFVVIMRGIRRKEKAITDEDELKEILTSAKYITFAMCKGDDPYLVTVSHGYDHDKNALYFHCASEGKKIDYLSVNNKIWGQALVNHGYASGECNHHYSTVQFSGEVEFLTNTDEKRGALTKMIDQLEENLSLRQTVKEKQLKEKAIKKVNIGKITIHELSGKKG